MKTLFKAGFFRRIVVPALLAIILFVVTVFAFVIPAFNKSAMQQKQSMLLELTNTAWSILQKYHHDQSSGLISLEEAQKKAIAEIEALRYGAEKKDYFWITDMTPAMIMHPYVQDLNGQSLTEFADPDGKKLFLEAREIAKTKGEGFVSYKWQFMDDSTNIVPKLSFVKVFEPWQWIIGTGVYIDDVEKEISSLTNKMILILVAISLLISLIIFFITYQSLEIEDKRQKAEIQLHESREKYKSLVESSTEGIILLLNNKISYSNAYIQTWLQYAADELDTLNINEIIEEVIPFEKGTLEQRVDVRLIKKDKSHTEAIMTILPVSFAEKEGLLLTFRDMSEHVTVKTALEVNREMIQQIAEIKKLGIFQFSLDSKSRIVKYNQQLASILGYTNPDELQQVSLSKITGGRSVLKQIIAELSETGVIQSKQIKLLTAGNRFIDVKLSLFLGKGNGNQRHCNGIAEIATIDSCILKSEENKPNSLSNLIGRNNLTLSELYDLPVFSPADAPVNDVIKLMSDHQSRSVILMMNYGCVGIITQRDLLTRYFLQDINPNNHAITIATAPVLTINENQSIPEAYSFMIRNKISQVPVLKSSGEISGVVYMDRLAGKYIDLNELGMLLLKSSRSVQELLKFRKSLPEYFGYELGQNGNIESFTGVLSGFNDSITQQIITNAIKETGPPPVPFSFFSFGSAGRREIAFNSDQDNAIIYEDSDEIPETELQKYFLTLAEWICRQLDQTGLAMCKGGYMASNPAWCKPASIWKKYFLEWIENAEPENILNISVFFDFRHIYGDELLFSKLEDYVYEILKGKTAFFYFLARNISLLKPGQGKTTHVISETGHKRSEIIDMKNSVSIIVQFVRIYTLHHNIRLKGTLERARALYRINAFSKATFDEVVFQYNFLMNLRLSIQLKQIASGEEPSNHSDVKKLTEMEQFILKKVHQGMSEFDDRLSAEFMSAYKG